MRAWRYLACAAFVITVQGAVPAAETPAGSTTPSAATAPVATAPGAASANAAVEFQPGAKLTSQDADRPSNQLPAALKLALKRGLRARITPTERLEWSQGFERATEKYAPQVTLDAHDYLANYSAGMPFPLIDATDPKAAVKIAYNWHMGPVLPDDFSLAPWGTSAYTADPNDAQRIISDGDYDFTCDQLDFLRFAHRTEVDPRPTLGATSMDVEWKAKCSRWSQVATGNFSEGSGIWVRHLGPEHPDEFFGFNETTRRVRRSSIHLEYPREGCRSCHQPYWAYALPKTEDYSYRLLGSTAILACMNADHEPAGIAPVGDGYRLQEEPFQLRRAYILEMTPRVPPPGPATRTVIYIDSEIYLWLAAEFYQDGQLSAVTIPLWRMSPSPEGGNRFDIAGSFYFPTAHPDYFRSLAPAHSSFTQQINRGELSEGDFLPQAMR
jgi:hypothetical protein